MKKSLLVPISFTAVIVMAVAWWMFGSEEDQPTQEAGIILPTLTSIQVDGKALFDTNCSACHGRNASGSEQGPPLVHIIYEPNHHGDASFYRAAALGVRAHHWRFGNMPAVEGVTEADVAKIIDYVRALQRANGID